MDDAFLVGDDLLVAPVLVDKQRERELFIPPGEWVDQRNSVSFRGPAVVRIQVPLEELAYFKRK